MNAKKLGNFLGSKKGNMLITAIMAISVSAVVVGIVAIPLVQQAAENVTGSAGTIMGVISTLLAVLLITAIVKSM